MKNLLLNQVAIVTGGNAGIGKAISLKLAEEGAKIAIIGTNLETGAAAVEEIKRSVSGAEVLFYPIDVSKTVDVEEVIKKILDHFGQIDILVNNAGVTADQLLMKMSEEEWDRVLAVNLKSCYNSCRAVVRSMMKAKKGKIINISSVVGLTGNPGQVNYAASKAGMIGFTKALAKELAGKNILVNCVAPGFIQTNMTNKLSESKKETIVKEIPLGRMGDPSDIAYAVWFLASPLSNYMTGQVMTVDGGMVM
jgi:3-oxoacyl-[acyl-carrier protein] reductase